MNSVHELTNYSGQVDVTLDQSHAVIVLGMHRSGTSAITRGLKALGVELGDALLEANPEVNAKGFWEDSDITAFNDRLLEALGMRWHSVSLFDPSQFPAATLISFRESAQALLEEKFRGVPLWGFKDPRVCRLLPFWTDVFRFMGVQAHYLIAVRNPLSVARSLAKRDGFAREKSYLLWLEHVLPSVSQTLGEQPIVVDYDLLMEQPLPQLERIGRWLGRDIASIPPAELEYFARDFLTQDLRHSQHSDAELEAETAAGPLVRGVFSQLNRLAQDQAIVTDPDFQAQWRALEESVSHLAPFLHYLESVEQRYDRAESERATYVAWHGQLTERVQVLEDQELPALRQELERAGLELAQAQGALEQAHGQAAEQASELAARKAEIIELQRRLAQVWASASWRLSAPVRWTGKSLRAARGLLQGPVSQVTGDPDLRYNLDWLMLDMGEIHGVGWIFHRTRDIAALSLLAGASGELLATVECAYGTSRADVAAHFPDVHAAELSGFTVRGRCDLRQRESDLWLQVNYADGGMAQLPARPGGSASSQSTVMARLRGGIARHGLIGAAGPALRSVYTLSRNGLRNRLNRREYQDRTRLLLEQVRAHQGFIDLFHVPMGWHTPLFQRFQHMSLQAARLGGLALYGGNPQVDKGLFVAEAVADRLSVFDATDPYLTHRLLDVVAQSAQPKLLRIQSIDLVTTSADIQRFVNQGFVVVYEYIDEISNEITGHVPALVRERHQFALGHPDVIVVATSDKLYEDVRADARRCLLSTNGVDLAHWREVGGEPPADLRPALESGRCIVGYHGALARWLDYDILKAIAEDERFELVLIGHEHDDAFAASGLAQLPRVHFLGSKSYFELNRYACHYGIAILPFRRYELTESVSPVKLFEYMAAGKPIVTTDIRECLKYRSCLSSASPQEFMDNLGRALELRTDPDYQAVLAAEAADNSWESKARRVLEFAGISP